MKVWICAVSALFLMAGCQLTAPPEPAVGGHPAISDLKHDWAAPRDGALTDHQKKTALKRSWDAEIREAPQMGKTVCHATERYENRPKASPCRILRTGEELARRNKAVVRGSCWDFVNAIYNRSGYPPEKRRVVFRGKKSGPYATTALIRPGDWLYYVNHSYNDVEHSAIFVEWIDRRRKTARMLSYAGEGRGDPVRYAPYELDNVYYIIRPKVE